MARWKVLLLFYTDPLLRLSAHLSIYGQVIIQRRLLDGGMSFHLSLHQRRDVQIFDLVFQKSCNRDLIGRIQNTRIRGALTQRFECQFQTAEILTVGLLECQVGIIEKVEAWKIRVQSVGIGQRILDWKLHVWQTHLSLHGAVLELNDTVDNALGMNDHIDLLRGESKQPFGFDHL